MKLLILPDIHFPYEVNGLLSFLKDIKRKHGPFDRVIQTGDLIDAYCFSKFQKDPNGDSLNQELDSARIQVGKLAEIFPEMTVLIGNHEDRFFKRAQEAGIPSKLLRSLEHILEFPEGWSYQRNVTVDGIFFTHGEQVNGRSALDTLINLYRKPTVIGHLHSVAGIKYMSNGSELTWAAAFGCLVDVNALQFAYGKHSKDQPVVGCGIIEDGVPRFIPFYSPKKR